MAKVTVTQRARRRPALRRGVVVDAGDERRFVFMDTSSELFG
jgi:hypothetical protein